MGLYNWLTDKITHWLVHEDELDTPSLCDFDRLSFEIRPCDVLLIEGRSRVSNVIKSITHSPWTHSALYIGRIHEIENSATRELVQQHYQGDSNDQLIIEPLLGEGTIVASLKKYDSDNLRICRPTGLSRKDSSKVIAYATHHLGGEYDVRHLLDLARFLLPWWFIPRRWRSSLFTHNVGETTRTVCSSMIAAAFASVHFPILPVVHRTPEGGLRLYKRNIRLYTPPDFDYSPYFEIIKYPLLGFNDLAVYRQLPWDQDGIICNDPNDCYIPPLPANPLLNASETKVSPKSEKKSKSKKEDKKHLQTPDTSLEQTTDTQLSSVDGDMTSGASQEAKSSDVQVTDRIVKDNA